MKFRTLVIYSLIALFLAGVFVQAQSPLEIRAASSTAVAGWLAMPAPGGVTLWVSPTTALVAGDIARAEARTQADGQRAVGVVFTADGARKMTQLSSSQLEKPIAVLLDGRIVSAPTVRSTIGNEAVFSGAPDAVERMLALLKR